MRGRRRSTSGRSSTLATSRPGTNSPARSRTDQVTARPGRGAGPAGPGGRVGAGEPTRGTRRRADPPGTRRPGGPVGDGWPSRPARRPRRGVRRAGWEGPPGHVVGRVPLGVLLQLHQVLQVGAEGLVPAQHQRARGPGPAAGRPLLGQWTSRPVQRDLHEAHGRVGVVVWFGSTQPRTPSSIVRCEAASVRPEDGSRPRLPSRLSPKRARTR